VEENAIALGEYVYNGLGQRIKKTVDGTTTIFHYDFDSKIIGESAPDGTFSKEYLYTSYTPKAMVDVASGELYYYLNDYLGTPQMLVDSTNMIVWEVTYKPFGEALVNTKSPVENNFRFPGQYYDKETGLHYNYYRYYDSKSGRYLRPDPIGLSGTDPNLYGYVLNNPLNSMDPLGLRNWGRITTGAFEILGGTTAIFIGAGIAAFGVSHTLGTLGLTTILGVAHIGGGIGVMWAGGWLLNLGWEDIIEGWRENELTIDPC
jgi:RHS repeat-associated protein